MQVEHRLALGVVLGLDNLAAFIGNATPTASLPV
jgi:hypothetical protein